jgi:PAS domain S-box-containing protein
MKTENSMNEQKYTDLVVNMPIAYGLHQMLYNNKGEAVDYRFLDVNAAFEELTGLIATEVIGKTLLEMLPDSEPFWIQKYAECIRTGERAYYENYSQALKRHYQVIAYSPAPEQFITLFLDITDRKAEFHKAEDIASFYQTITENASDGVIILDNTFKYSYISPNAYKMFGYEPSEMRLLEPSKLTHPDDLEFVLTEIQKTIQNPDFKPTLEYRFLKKNGDWIWIESKISNLFSQPNVNGLVINFKEITERRIANLKLKESEALLAATLRHSRFSIWSIDTNYHLLYANDTFKNDFLQIFGVELEVGMNLLNTLSEPLKMIWLDRYSRTFSNNSFLEEDVIDLGNQ